MLRDDEIELPVQILGKVRGRITVPADADQKQVEQIALADERSLHNLKARRSQSDRRAGQDCEHHRELTSKTVHSCPLLPELLAGPHENPWNRRFCALHY
jgi:leucyl-tRNA synthetase